MSNICLEAKTKEQEILKKYLEDNASDVLTDKINNGVKIEKDGKTVINKKTLDTFMKYATEEAKKLAEMDAQQKAEYERDQLKKELDDLKRKDSISEMTKTARKMLSDKSITVSDELLAMMVTTDAEETKKAIDGFAKAFTDAVENAVKERLKGAPPRRGSGSAPAMTKEQIMAIRDPELRQKKMLEHRDLFNI
jgi:hypothetical protein